MTFPFSSLMGEHRSLGLVLAVVLGFLFGFVLERAGFGRADKLAGQFYLREMTVFKVMFSAILTAMIGMVLAAGLGLVELRALSQGAVSETFVWSMIAGGLLLGVGFVISGYCPGTSIVASASGNLDGMVTFVGVVLGSLVFAEAFPLLGKLYQVGGQGHLFLYDLLPLPASLLALLITVLALGAFLGADWVERWSATRRGLKPAPASVRPRRAVFAALASGGLLAVATLVLPAQPQAAPVKTVELLAQAELARRIIDEPWTLRILDLREAELCAKARIPGAECAPVATLKDRGLPYMAGQKDLVLVSGDGKAPPPAAALGYPGRILHLAGGFAGWRAFALTPPPPPPADAEPAERAAYTFRAAMHGAMTGIKAPPPPPASKKYVPQAGKKKGGGCS